MSLFLIRSFGRRNIPVYAIDSNISSFYSRSKYCIKVPCDSLFDKSLIDALVNTSKSLGTKPVLINCTDQSVINVANNFDTISDYYNIVMPDASTINNLISKKHLYDFSTTHNFTAPNTFFSDSLHDLEIIGGKITYPCIIKPEIKDKYWQSNVPGKVIFTDTKEMYWENINKYKLYDKSLIIQEWIEGDDTDLYFCLVYIGRNHNVLSLFTGRKIRQHPHLAGTLTIAESIWVPEIAEQTIKLLNKAGCVGFCSVEYKKSRTDEKYYIMEPTVGRPDSQEEICMSAGLDIPYIAYLDALGGDPPPLGEFQEGVKWIDVPRVYYTFRECFKGDLRWRELFHMLRGKKTYNLWAIDDPMPALTYMKGIFLSKFGF